MKILFVTWDGPQVNYLESLFLPIFEGLRPHGFEFDILQFRFGTDAEEKAVRAACAAAGCGYTSVKIWRWGPLGAFASALRGGFDIRRALRRYGSRAIMPRSVLPSLALLASGAARATPVLMDADGLEIDERAEFARLETTGLVYRVLRDIEAQMVRRSTAILTRTEGTRDILMARAGPPADPSKYTIVTNGRDGRIFHPFDEESRAGMRRELGIAPDAPLLVYAGSLGGRYRTRWIGELALELRALRPDTRLLILSGSPEVAHSELIGPLPELAEFTIVRRAPPGDVPRYLAAADVGTAFISESYSTRGIAPVKTGEYLLCGVPIVGTAAVGDNQAPLAAGVFFDDSRGLSEAARWIADAVLPNRQAYRENARSVGVERFSLERSISDYRDALANLQARQGPTSR
ncbi:MAG TPA: glycosyltransferase family 4 protein [Allosphingosinicella sp.]